MVLLRFIERAGRHADEAEVGQRRWKRRTSLKGGTVIVFRGCQLTGTVKLKAVLEPGTRLVVGYLVCHVTLPLFLKCSYHGMTAKPRENRKI
jgi:hypothetical protein